MISEDTKTIKKWLEEMKVDEVAEQVYRAMAAMVERENNCGCATDQTMAASKATAWLEFYEFKLGRR